MDAPRGLHHLLDAAAARSAEHVAIAEIDGECIGYRELAALSDRVRDRLQGMGVRHGNRVGIYLRKSIDAVAAIFGVLKTGAAYVPLDPEAPVSRNAFIIEDCALRAVIVERRWRDDLEGALGGSMPAALALDGVGGGAPLRDALAGDEPGLAVADHVGPDDVAYVLYTSGSTGKPKGVMLSHRAGLAFVGWCAATFAPTAADRFASHAPFHFDLSIFDLYLPLRCGARILLIGETAAKEPARLAALIAAERLTVWYSVPSMLTLLAQYGKLERHDCAALRLVLFAGEVFPVKHLRQLVSRWPHPRYFNLYGPTETNVCTFYELPASIPAERAEPFPIGRSCSHLRTMIVDEMGRPSPPGAVGELCVAGPALMRGYWNRPEETARAFLDGAGAERWYRTGDLVGEDDAGDYVFHGRRDRMVKRRGYRVELGEVEAALSRHPAVREAAAIAVPDAALGVRIMAVLGCDAAPSIIELKRFCAGILPAYMIPDVFAFRAALPRTSNGKIDLQQLAEEAVR